MTNADPIGQLQDRLRHFAAERDWERFHDPKNLVMALAGEAGELVEVLQWVDQAASRTAGQDPVLAPRLAEEMADVFLYLLQLAEVTGIDLVAAAHAKIIANARRYPPLPGREG